MLDMYSAAYHLLLTTLLSRLQVMEGGRNRRLRQLRNHLYAVFRPNKKAETAIFDRYNHASTREALLIFLDTEFSALRQGRMQPSDFLARFECLKESFDSNGKHRTQVEEFAQNTLQAIADEKKGDVSVRAPSPTVLQLCLMATVGEYGLSGLRVEKEIPGGSGRWDWCDVVCGVRCVLSEVLLLSDTLHAFFRLGLSMCVCSCAVCAQVRDV